MTRERRRYRRLKTKNVAGHVRVKDEVLAFGLPIENISLGGVFVRTTTPLPAGTPVVLELTQPSLKAPLKVVGTTVLSLDAAQASAAGATPGMGVRFDPLSPEASSTLSALLSTLTQEGKAAVVGAHNPAAIDESVETSRQAFDFKFVSLDGFADEEPPYFLSPPAASSSAAIVPPPSPPKAPAAAVPARTAIVRPPPAPEPAVATPAPASPAPTPNRGHFQAPVRVTVPGQPQANPKPGHVAHDAPVQVTESARLMVQVRGLLQDLDETRLELERRGEEIERLRRDHARLQTDLKKKDERIAELEIRLAQK